MPHSPKTSSPHSPVCRPIPVLALILASAWLPAPEVRAQSTRRVSVTSQEAEVPSTSQFSDCDAASSQIVFSSHSKDLVPNDNNFAWDIFVRDRRFGTTVRVNVSSGGQEANNDSFHPSISDDGRYVAYESEASNLVSGDTNGSSDVFVVDRETGNVVRASVDSNGNQADGGSFRPHLSGDGRFVAFESLATNLVKGDSNGAFDVFVHELATGITIRASTSSRGAEGDDDSRFPRLSADGGMLVFASDADNLVSSDNNRARDVFLKDFGNGTTMRVSEVGGIEGDADSDRPDIDADGSMVVFESMANNLLPEDVNAGTDVFLRHTQFDSMELISVTTDEESVHGAAVHPTISANGIAVAFTGYSTDLVPNDNNGERDIFVRDRGAGTTERVSIRSGGAEADSWSDFAQISADGGAVVFHSPATDLVGGDTNGTVDVFCHGPWFVLKVVPEVLYENDPFEIIVFDGKPRGLLLLQVIALNGKPFRYNIDLGRFDADGQYALSSQTPPGLAGIGLDLITYGFDEDELLHASNVAQMLFR